MDNAIANFMDEVFDAIKEVDTSNETRRKFLDAVGIERSLFDSYDGVMKVTFEIPIHFDWDDEDYHSVEIINDSIVGLIDLADQALIYHTDAADHEVHFGTPSHINWEKL
jgi:hypothetical protein